MNKFVKLIALVTVATTLSACGNNFATKLPDDPTTEQVVPDENGAESLPSESEDTPIVSGDEEEQILANYSYVDPTRIVPDKPLKAALVYYAKNLTKVKNKNVLSVIDFSQHSGKKRFFIINMKTGSVWAIRVAHGKGSDPEHDGYLNKFSNVSGSNASSEGYYLTAETYNGSNGYSLKLDGMSSTNSRARSRAIVIHGADYVQEANVIQGRSWGCPAVAHENRDKLINMIKGGSVIYASK